VPDSTIIASEIYILSQIQPEIWELPFYCFTAAILDFWWNGMSNNVGDSTVENFDLENMRVATGILFLSALELEINLGGNSTPLWITNVSTLYWTLGGLTGLRTICPQTVRDLSDISEFLTDRSVVR
jgi:hypothetical protein